MSYCIYCMAHLNDGETNCHRCGKAQNYIAPLHQLAPGTVLCDRYYIGSALGEALDRKILNVLQFLSKNNEVLGWDFNDKQF